jgi:hypothetical protein
VFDIKKKKKQKEIAKIRGEMLPHRNDSGMSNLVSTCPLYFQLDFQEGYEDLTLL